MVWTPPIPFVPGPLTAATMNTYVADNLTAVGSTTAAVAVPARSGFSSDLNVERAGFVVCLSGSIARTSGTGSSFTPCADIPAGFLPRSTHLFGALTFASSTNYEIRVYSSGLIQIRLAASTSAPCGVEMSWVTDDAWPA